MLVIKVEGLTKRFGLFTAVDHLNFEIEEGEVFGLLGPNGAGKTTTIRMLACLISPSEGSAEIGGYNVYKDKLKIREIVGVLTENPCLYERLTAYENMDFFAEAYGITDKQERRVRIRELLELFNLWDHRNDEVYTFSRGMKQKLAIARALVHRPHILFLDEPTANLDPESSKEIRDLIETLSQRERCTILLSTHRLEDAERLCNRVMIIKEGKHIITGSPKELCEKVAGSPVLQITLKKLDQRIIEVVKKLKQVKEVKVRGSSLIIDVDNINLVTPEIIKRIVYVNGMILSVNILYPSLEEAYLKLVGGEYIENR